MIEVQIHSDPFGLPIMHGNRRCLRGTRIEHQASRSAVCIGGQHGVLDQEERRNVVLFEHELGDFLPLLSCIPLDRIGGRERRVSHTVRRCTNSIGIQRIRQPRTYGRFRHQHRVQIGLRAKRFLVDVIEHVLEQIPVLDCKRIQEN